MTYEFSLLNIVLVIRNEISTAMNLVPQEYCGLISEYNLLPTS